MFSVTATMLFTMLFARFRLRGDRNRRRRRYGRWSELPSAFFSMNHFRSGLQTELLLQLSRRAAVGMRAQLFDA